MLLSGEDATALNVKFNDNSQDSIKRRDQTNDPSHSGPLVSQRHQNISSILIRTIDRLQDSSSCRSRISVDH